MRPNLDDIQVLEEIQVQLESYPDKELLAESARFGVFLFGVLAVGVIGLLSPYLPVLEHVPTETIAAMGWQLVALVLGFLAARTVRNTK